jgi:hypothetical protein
MVAYGWRQLYSNSIYRRGDIDWRLLMGRLSGRCEHVGIDASRDRFSGDA